MIESIFVKGLIIGFSVAAIIGPISLMCIRRTIAEGQLVGIAIGIGSACADAIFALIAGFGITLIADIIIKHLLMLRIMGGLFLVYLGTRIFFERVPEKVASITASGFIGTVASTLLLTLTNPMTIFSFSAIFAGLGISCTPSEPGPIITLAIAVFLGALAWWIILTSFLRLFHARVNQKTLIIINRIAGGLIAAFGLAALISIFFVAECPVPL